MQLAHLELTGNQDPVMTWQIEVPDHVMPKFKEDLEAVVNKYRGMIFEAAPPNTEK
jgi:hypothetical protein